MIVKLPFPDPCLFPNAKAGRSYRTSTWSREMVDTLVRMYPTHTNAQIAEVLSVSGPSLRAKKMRLGLNSKVRPWSQEDIETIRAAYSGSGYADIGAIAERLGRTIDAVSLKVSKTGLGNACRSKVKNPKGPRQPKFKNKEDRSLARSEFIKKWIADNGHPKGATGMKHSAETKELISKASFANAAAMTDEQKAASTMKMMRTKVARGTANPMRDGVTWKSGWREVGGVRKYYRSKWEANYAYYLQWLKEKGQISDWKHEPKTFWFEGVKRGTVSYLPDFWVQEVSGAEAYHEVKGWMDDRSKTKIARMARYHPKVKLIVIDAKGYASLKKSVMGLVPGWEI